MKEILYVMLMGSVKPMTETVIKEHVEHLRRLDDAGRLVLCGPFLDFKGGMVIFRAENIDEARRIAASDPFVAQGYRSFEVRTLEWTKRENNYGL